MSVIPSDNSQALSQKMTPSVKETETETEVLNVPTPSLLPLKNSMAPLSSMVVASKLQLSEQYSGVRQGDSKINNQEGDKM